MKKISICILFLSLFFSFGKMAFAYNHEVDLCSSLNSNYNLNIDGIDSIQSKRQAVLILRYSGYFNKFKLGIDLDSGMYFPGMFPMVAEKAEFKGGYQIYGNDRITIDLTCFYISCTDETCELSTQGMLLGTEVSLNLAENLYFDGSMSLLPLTLSSTITETEWPGENSFSVFKANLNLVLMDRYCCFIGYRVYNNTLSNNGTEYIGLKSSDLVYGVKVRF